MASPSPHTSPHRFLPFRFYLISGQGTRHQPEDWLTSLAQAGLQAFQLRDKSSSASALERLAVRAAALRGLIPGPRPLLLLNTHAELARQWGFQGVHLPQGISSQGSGPHPTSTPHPPGTWLVGRSCHSLEEVIAAEREGADFATFGPVFPTPSKQAYGPPLGLAALAAAAQGPLPLIALGGITPENTPDCLAAGAWGVAAIRAVWDAPDPLAALNQFRQALGGNL
ncbi:MAG: thiamine phosphate synthase [Deltaproteobacteria bacterium]|nr:thiamine phosphate synthase [Deltaproteobacteria bacterium]